jgi:hypothetical protein
MDFHFISPLSGRALLRDEALSSNCKIKATIILHINSFPFFDDAKLDAATNLETHQQVCSFRNRVE